MSFYTTKNINTYIKAFCMYAPFIYCLICVWSIFSRLRERLMWVFLWKSFCTRLPYLKAQWQRRNMNKEFSIISTRTSFIRFHCDYFVLFSLISNACFFSSNRLISYAMISKNNLFRLFVFHWLKNILFILFVFFFTNERVLMLLPFSFIVRKTMVKTFG